MSDQQQPSQPTVTPPASGLVSEPKPAPVAPLAVSLAKPVKTGMLIAVGFFVAQLLLGLAGLALTALLGLLGLGISLH